MAIIYNDVGKGKEREQGRGREIVYNNRQAKREGAKMFHVKQFGFLWFSALLFLLMLRSLQAVPLCCVFVFRLSSFFPLFLAIRFRHKRGNNSNTIHLFTVCSIVSRETISDSLFLSSSSVPVIRYGTFSQCHHNSRFPSLPFWFSITDFFIPITSTSQKQTPSSLPSHASKMFHVKQFPPLSLSSSYSSSFYK